MLQAILQKELDNRGVEAKVSSAASGLNPWEKGIDAYRETAAVLQQASAVIADRLAADFYAAADAVLATHDPHAWSPDDV